ncbi:MAG: alpha/beta fold hydrolase [Bacteroidota bacterium]
MPLLNATYRKPFFLFNAHLETIYPALFRRIRDVQYERERLELSDGDFVDLDWLDQGSRRLVLLTHGLEGNSDRHYIKGMARHFASQGWDALAWNCRSCSGEMNRNLRLYNHGEIEDIGEVIQHALRTKDYEEIVMIGFSMGGSITFKYLGVNSGKGNVPEVVRKAIGFSTPCDLMASAHLLDDPRNKIYRDRFARMLFAKISAKAEQFPGVVDLSNFEKIKVWKDFDNFFSAPINGYRDADDFYYQASAIHYMEPIEIPCLLVNAINDPILSPECSPEDFAQRKPNFFLETPRHGGHVGFNLINSKTSWAERRAWEFVN